MFCIGEKFGYVLSTSCITAFNRFEWSSQKGFFDSCQRDYLDSFKQLSKKSLWQLNQTNFVTYSGLLWCGTTTNLTQRIPLLFTQYNTYSFFKFSFSVNSFMNENFWISVVALMMVVVRKSWTFYQYSFSLQWLAMYVCMTTSKKTTTDDSILSFKSSLFFDVWFIIIFSKIPKFDVPMFNFNVYSNFNYAYCRIDHCFNSTMYNGVIVKN